MRASVLRAPNTSVSFSSAHPTMRGLRRGLISGSFMNRNNGQYIYDHIRKVYLDTSAYGTPVWGSSIEGIVRHYDGSSGDRDESAVINGLTQYCVMARFRAIGYIDDDRIIAWGNSASTSPLAALSIYNTNNGIHWLVRDDNATVIYNTNAASNALNGEFHTFVVNVDLNASSILYAYDGTVTTLNRSNAPTTTSTFNRSSIGCVYRGIVEYCWDGQISTWAVWNRLLSAQELKTLSTNPYLLWQSSYRTITSGYSKAHYSVKGVV